MQKISAPQRPEDAYKKALKDVKDKAKARDKSKSRSAKEVDDILDLLLEAISIPKDTTNV